MKKLLLFFFLLAASFAGIADIIAPSGNVNKQAGYTPVFMSRETLEKSVMYISGSHELIRTGKIYYRDPYIFVNERYKGVHVINNTDPSHPVNEGFILAPGCIDMAVKDNILYLDNAVDLVSFDLDARQVTQRNRNVFPEPLPPDDLMVFWHYKRPNDYILVDWKKTYR